MESDNDAKNLFGFGQKIIYNLTLLREVRIEEIPKRDEFLKILEKYKWEFVSGKDEQKELNSVLGYISFLYRGFSCLRDIYNSLALKSDELSADWPTMSGDDFDYSIKKLKRIIKQSFMSDELFDVLYNEELLVEADKMMSPSGVYTKNYELMRLVGRAKKSFERAIWQFMSFNYTLQRR